MLIVTAHASFVMGKMINNIHFVKLLVLPGVAFGSKKLDFCKINGLRKGKLMF